MVSGVTDSFLLHLDTTKSWEVRITPWLFFLGRRSAATQRRESWLGPRGCLCAIQKT